MREKHIRKLKRKEGAELIEYYSKVNGKDVIKTKGPGGLGGKKKKAGGPTQQQRNANLLDESFEYDEKALTTKKIDILGKNKVLFENVFCENAFYVLSKDNKFRIFVYKICVSTTFEWIIMILVVLSSLKLVVDSYLTGDPSQ